jgi:hypothetical protein
MNNNYLLIEMNRYEVGDDINGNLFAYQKSGWKTEQMNMPTYFNQK